MPSQTRYPSSSVNSGTGVQWSDPQNATASDDAYASAGLNIDQSTSSLRCTGFGFTIPAGARIDGIVVEYEARSSLSSTVRDSEVYLVLGGARRGSNRASSSFWPTSDTWLQRGGANDLWGTTWTPSDINASSFGVDIKAGNGGGSLSSAYIDAVRITVYYTIIATKSGQDGIALADSAQTLVRRPISQGDQLSLTEAASSARTWLGIQENDALGLGEAHAARVLLDLRRTLWRGSLRMQPRSVVVAVPQREVMLSVKRSVRVKVH